VLALRRTRNVHSIPEFRALQKSDAFGKVLTEKHPFRRRDNRLREECRRFSNKHDLFQVGTTTGTASQVKESNGLMLEAALGPDMD
jgi:hypothetical protein